MPLETEPTQRMIHVALAMLTKAIVT